MKDPRTVPFIRCELTLSDGSMLVRSWTLEDMASTQPPDLGSIPPWLANSRKSWPHPQDPVTFRGDVVPGHEAEARAFLGLV